MRSKILKLLGSLRFWIITLGSTAVYLGLVEANGFHWNVLFDSIAIWLGTVAGVGTIDKFSENKKV